MVNPINTFFDNLHCQTLIIEDDEEILGVIKAECHQECLFLHPKLYKVNKQTLRIFKQKFLEFADSLRNNLYYEHCYADTEQGRWVKFLTNNKAKPVGKGIEGILYEYELI